jgi:hypothetical protein
VLLVKLPLEESLTELVDELLGKKLSEEELLIDAVLMRELFNQLLLDVLLSEELSEGLLLGVLLEIELSEEDRLLDVLLVSELSKEELLVDVPLNEELTELLLDVLLDIELELLLVAKNVKEELVDVHDVELELLLLLLEAEDVGLELLVVIGNCELEVELLLLIVEEVKLMLVVDDTELELLLVVDCKLDKFDVDDEEDDNGSVKLVLVELFKLEDSVIDVDFVLLFVLLAVTDDREVIELVVTGELDVLFVELECVDEDVVVL